MNFRIVSAAFAACASAALLGAAPAPEGPFVFDKTPGRLPKDVVPLVYRIAITPDGTHYRFAGSETVTLNVRKPTSTVIFNALNIRYQSARVDGAPVSSITPNDRSQRTTLRTTRPLGVGTHTLALVYTGKIETAAAGLFRQDYRAPNGGTGTLLSTQFESTDARRMFPSWDEPAFRASYQLTATLPAGYSVVSNTPPISHVVHGKLATTTFAATPRMSSYLVVLSAGNLGHRDAVDTQGTRHEVWSVRGRENQSAYALANSQQILTAYDAYFGIRFPLPKLSSIAVPGGFGGAMENWGGITYNDQLLLLPPSATVGQKQEVYSVQAHEMAHQWFGDLVTMAWWDDLWLNESFASWMSARQTDKANPDWQWWQNEDGSAKENAMDADARLGSQPIQTHVVNEVQADAAFDPAITYSKGEWFLRMMEAYLGPQTFQNGIQHYVAARKFSNATGADLWSALSTASGKDVGAIANRWILQPGFPLVSVTASCAADGTRTVALHQERFLVDGTDPAAAMWSIPVGIASGTSAPTYTLMTTRDASGIAAGRCDEPLRANAGNHGFYRVAYDPTTFATDRKNFSILSDDDKIVMLDDQWALTVAGKDHLTSFLALAGRMGTDSNARAWQTIEGALSQIESDERGTPGHDAFVAAALDDLRPLATQLGREPRAGDAPPVLKLRQALITFFGVNGDPATVAYARERFAALLHDRNAVPPDEQSAVLLTMAALADQTTFDQLHTLAKSAHDETEMDRYYGALMNVKDPALAAQALAITISSEIPPQAASNRLEFALGVSNWNPKLSFDFVRAHSDRLFATFTRQDRVFIAEFLPGIVWKAAPLDQIEAYLRSVSPPEAAPQLAQGMARARFQLKLHDRLIGEADALHAHS